MKPYHEHGAELGLDGVAHSSAPGDFGSSSVELSSAEIGKSVSGCVVVLSGTDSVVPAVTLVEMPTAGGEDDIGVPV